jgi:hypothetical protein
MHLYRVFLGIWFAPQIACATATMTADVETEIKWEAA